MSYDMAKWVCTQINETPSLISPPYLGPFYVSYITSIFGDIRSIFHFPVIYSVIYGSIFNVSVMYSVRKGQSSSGMYYSIAPAEIPSLISPPYLGPLSHIFRLIFRNTRVYFLIFRPVSVINSASSSSTAKFII